MANDNAADIEFEVEPEAETQDQAREYIQYLGEEPHGTAFLTSHTIPKGDGLWKRAKLKVTKDIVWERDPYGPKIGQLGNRMLVPVEDLPDGVAEQLEKLPDFKRVSD